MKQMIEGLFTAMEQSGEFEDMDRLISDKCTSLLKPYENRLSAQDYEAVRDIIYSIYAVSKKDSFEAGFKSAMRLVLECCTDRLPT